MKKMFTKNAGIRRLLALALALVLGMNCLPTYMTAITANAGIVDTKADNVTMNRFDQIYGTNTRHAGKVTVDKSVSNTGLSIDGKNVALTEENNFLVTISQAAQVMALSTQMETPVDVVFVLDTSGSMAAETTVSGYNFRGQWSNRLNRTEAMVNTINSMIQKLMEANPQNRVGVVAFSAHNSQAGTAGADAANVLSELASYTGEAATKHLTYGTGTCDWAGGTVTTVQGRSYTNGKLNSRYYTGGATNIQAGLATGAKLLLDKDAGTTATVEGQTVTRVPILILMSDGAPSVSSSNNDWWNPSQTQNQGDYSLTAGNSMLTQLVGSYYKNAISQHYYPNGNGKATIYTVGLEVSSDEMQLSRMTLNPAEELSNTGNTFRSEILTAWNQYVANESFRVKVSNEIRNGSYTHDGYYYFYNTDTTVNQPNDIKDNETWSNAPRTTFSDNIDNSVTTLAYNDEYYEVTQASNLQATFDKLLIEINKKAITAPTHVSTTEEFDGYVTFTDVIGEYMEVKEMKGVLADGNFYQGKYAARNFGSNGSDAAFDASLEHVIGTRMTMTKSGDVTAAGLIANAVANNTYNGQKTQAYYNSDTDYDNSIVWWGKTYATDDGFETGVQCLGNAVDDSIAYITDSSTVIPTEADVVCRSYFFYGTAGGTVANPNHDYLYFIVRVQRSLTAPYQETVMISAPASLLSMSKVYITEDKTGTTTTYTAAVEEAAPARVVYEVGLRSDINAYNIDQIVGRDTAYTSQVPVDGQGGINYDAATGTYYFYTNDWDRAKASDTHGRAMSKATFYAASNNSYYTYQEDTYLYDKDGNIYNGASAPAGTAYYYRDVYSWSGTTNAAGEYQCTVASTLIPITIPAAGDAAIQKDSTGWYIKAGAYTAAVMNPDGVEEVAKSVNVTNTSIAVAHPVRTGDSSDAHYTVYLGNNGVLSMTAEKAKTVDITTPGTTQITNADGKVVTVGDYLTYHVKVVNTEGAAVTAVVTDTIPAGTELVAGSITDNGVLNASTGIITWNLDLAKDDSKTVSFTVEVTEDALHDSISNVENAASVQVGNNPAYTTNKVENPTQGKIVEAVESGVDSEDGIKVGQELIYHIYYVNDTDAEADVTITDVIPAGTNYVSGSASHNGGLAEGTTNKLVWTIQGVDPGKDGVVTFRVIVDASAKSPIENGATIEIGENGPIYTTNKTSTDVLTGDLKLTKTVNGTTANETFTLVLTEAGRNMEGYGTLSGTFVAERTRGNGTISETVTFTEGVATVNIMHGDTLLIKDLPAGTIISVTEQTKKGYTPGFSPVDGQVTVSPEAAVSVAVTNTYKAANVDFQLLGKKVLNTDDFFAGTTFVANVYTCNVSGIVNGDVNNAVWTVTDNLATTARATVSSSTKEAQLIFGQRTFTKDDIGKHYYLITEFNNGVTGVTYDETQYRLMVEVKDNGDGTLSAIPTVWKKAMGETAFTLAATGDNVNNNAVVTFTNEYQPLEASIVLVAKKTLANKTLKGGEFGFEVIENGTAVSTGQNDEKGNIVFKQITYNSTGTHIYTIKEVVGDSSSIKYDTSEFTVTVNVTDSNNDGRLEATATYPTGGVVFENVYKPAATGVSLTASKTLEGRELTNGEFTFEVLDANDKVVATGHNDADGNIAFSEIPITYDENGTYPYDITYEVKEAIPTGAAKDPYMGYDRNVYEVIVNVSIDKGAGMLCATVTSIEKNGVVVQSIDFTNTQYADSITVTPTAGKTTTVSGGDVTGGNAYKVPEGSTFSFSVREVQNDGSVGEEVAVGVGEANTTAVKFSPLTFTEAGTYKYFIQESNVGNTHNGITYDKTRYLMEVTVTHTNGELRVDSLEYRSFNGNGSRDDADYYTVEMDGTPQFTNVYDAKGSLNIIAEKTLTGREIKDGEFAFKLVRVNDAGNPIGGEIDGLVSADTKNDETGSKIIKFATMYYSMEDLEGAIDKVKIIRYVMSEVIPLSAKVPGVTYDRKIHYIYVKLTDTGNGTIKAELCDEKGNPKLDANGNPTTDTGIIFENNYAPATGTFATITASKAVVKPDGANADYPLNGGEFTFNLYYVEGSTETLVDTVTNDKDGNITFTRNYIPSAFPVSSPGETYTYVIREQVGNRLGISYNTATVYGVTVTVNHDPTSGSLSIDSNNGIKYYAGTGTGIVDWNTPMDLDETKVVFTNTYKAEGTQFTPKANKQLDGRDMVKDDEFSFEVKEVIKDGENEVVDRVVSVGLSKQEDGNIEFTPITYAEAGDYKYEISEVQGNLVGVKYSKQKYYVKVTVSDDKEGKLQVDSVKYYSDANCEQMIEGSSNVKFTNEYTEPTVNVQLEATKTLNGRDMKDYEFDFVVKAFESGQVGEVVAYGDNVTVEEGKPHKVLFSTLNYTLADAGKSFIYEISEVAPIHLNGIQIDTKTYYAVVAVKQIQDDEGDSVLTTEVSYYEDSELQNNLSDNTVPAFINNYDPNDASISLTAHKLLYDKKLAANEFTFVVKDNAGNIVKDANGKEIKAQNDAQGLVTFPALIFDKAGTYTYYVEEVDAQKDNYTYDDTVYKVVAEVKDNNNGELEIRNVSYFRSGTNDTSSIVSGGDAAVQSMNFTNFYTPSPLTIDLSAQIGATKAVVSPDGKNDVYQLNGGEFDFVVKDVSGKVVASGTNDKDGKITLSEFTFNKAGEYHYWISEKTSDKAGMITDNRQWQIQIHVKSNFETGKLEVADEDVKVYAFGRAVADTESPAFVNVYDPAPVKVTVTADKKLLNRELKDHEFAFRIMEDGLIVAESHNDADGVVTFSLEIDTAGTHTYSMREVIPAEAAEGIAYDIEIKTFTVAVVDDGNGQLKVDGLTEVKIATGFTFENVYTPPVGPEDPNLPDDPIDPDNPNTPDNSDTSDDFEEPDDTNEPTQTDTSTNVPPTGDTSNLLLWIILGLVSVIGIGVWAVCFKKRKDK